MKKITGLLPALVALALSACDTGSSIDTKLEIEPAKTNAIFAPGAGQIPIPNDLLFGGTQDLTLNIPVADPLDESDPKVAMNALDGWSAVAPFAIAFRNSRNDGTDLDQSTILPGQTIRMFETSVLRPEAIPGTGIIVPTGPVTGIVRELTPGVDFFAQYAGPLTVGVIPLKPLTPQANYMVVVTNGIKDTNGSPIVVDVQYSFAKGPNPLGGSTAALEPVRQLVNAMEAAAEADAGIDKASIVLSFQFTVQSVGDVVSSAKAFYLDFPASQGAVPPTSFSSLMTDTTPFTGIGAADLYKGQITSNYYLEAPSANNPLSVLNTHWVGADMVPDGQGGLTANPFAGGNLTYANKLPQVTGQETMPLLVSYPKAALCAKPAAGYPVMIFQHGITADRTNILGIADTMAAPPACTAVVAQDLPLHGIAEDNAVNQGLLAASDGAISIFAGYDQSTVHERTFGVDLINNATGAPGPDGIVDSSGAHTINLTNLLVSRDNTRQGVMDLLSLARAIPAMDIDGDGNPDLDSSNISYMGHSLGGIVGSSFVAYSDNIKSAVFANPGGGIAKMLDASLTFGPRIRAGLSAAGVDVNGPDYQSFLFATQTVLDSADPQGTSFIAQSNDVPTLMLQVKDDSVVPNSVATAPLSGTEPMAASLGLTTVTATTAGELVPGSRLFTKLNGGLHSTVLTPNDASGAPTLLPFTAEMQGEIASFILSGGAAVQVGDPSLLE